MDFNFYKKYMYYKNKYIKLKLEQNGGTDNSSVDNSSVNNSSVNIVSFNVLNEYQGTTMMTFKNNSDIITTKLLDNKPNKKQLNNIYKNLIQLEKREWELYRKNKILNLIDYFIKLNYIVCLQEVSENLLKELKNKYNKKLCYTSKLNDKNNEDYRVTIFSDKYSLINTQSIIFDGVGLKQKDCLLTILSDNKSNKFMVFNLHIYWKADQKHYSEFAKSILELVKNNKLPFVICGDFNGTINHPFLKIFIEIINANSKINTNSSNYLNDFTSINTKSKNEYAWIDHILTHGFKTLEPTSTLNKINGYKIYYDVKQIVEKLIEYKEKIIEKRGLENKMLKIFDNKKWLSDHKPVLISLGF